MLKELLKREEATIKARWLECSLQVYPSDGRDFFLSQKDQFHNPVGVSLVQGTSAIFDGLVENAEMEKFRSPLFNILRIRSIQELSPAQSLSFLYLLKNVIREVLGNELQGPGVVKDVEDLWARIDELVLEAFNIYVECKKKIYEIRVEETKRNVSGFLRRTGFFENNDNDTETTNAG